ncbi:MAG: ATP-dependent RNA helicase DbpA [Nitrospira sp.]|nr:ATP-dependent RNA helicase DbpA [Nitrospira sp.]
MNNQSGDLSENDFETEYRSIKETPASQFYQPCLLSSSVYKRAVGYFRSSVFIVIGPSIIAFARRGGRVRLLCSPELSQEDIDGIALGYGNRVEIVSNRLIADIDYLLSQNESAYPTRVLAALIALGALDIKVALRADRKGIYHEKIGVFTDQHGNKVSFKGSANESWSAWHSEGNFESIEVFCSWRGGLELERIRKHEAHFDSLWSENDVDVEVFGFPERALNHLRLAAPFGGIDDMAILSEELPDPKRSALAHQTDALNAWAAQGYRGILEHATGSGKTYTAVLAIKEHLAQGHSCLVLVPSRLLLDQWASELRSELPQAALLLAGGGHGRWRHPQRLRSMTAADPALGARIVLSTMQTASTDHFRSQVIEGQHLLLVADEVHQIGSTTNSRILGIDAGKRLGLSATPQRYGDPEGTKAILEYFGGIVPPPVTLIDAIQSGRLVPYEYYPHPVHLTASESEEWRTLSTEIKTEMARQPEDEQGNRRLSERAKLLLIRRSRLAKKASNKVDLARAVFRDSYEEGQHWLIYCEDVDQLSQVIEGLKADGHSPVEYHSNMAGERNAAMLWFRTYGGPLVSIRCLDEGVDIPVVSHALILASSQNPRQFIQRRGRVLRKIPGKHLAVIHDAIVVPLSIHDEPDQVALLKSELLRSIEFASHAINRMAAAELRTISDTLGFDGLDVPDLGLEEDDDGE